MKLYKILVTILIFSLFSSTSSELIIGNTNNTKLTITELKMIYLGKISRWDNGDKIILTILENGPIHESFMKNCLHKKSRSFILYWKQRMFTGRGVMPHIFKTEEELLHFIKENKGAIGYISDSLKDSLSEDILILKTCENL